MLIQKSFYLEEPFPNTMSLIPMHFGPPHCSRWSRPIHSKQDLAEGLAFFERKISYSYASFADRDDGAALKRLLVFGNNHEQMIIHLLRAHITQAKNDYARQNCSARRQEITEVEIMRQKDKSANAGPFQYLRVSQSIVPLLLEVKSLMPVPSKEFHGLGGDSHVG